MDMSMPDVVAQMEYFNEHPPIHLMIEAYLGIKPKTKAKAMDFEGMISPEMEGMAEKMPKEQYDAMLKREGIYDLMYGEENVIRN